MHGKFKFIDADLHVIEPKTLWRDRFPEKLKPFAPYGLAPERITVEFADGRRAPQDRHPDSLRPDFQRYVGSRKARCDELGIGDFTPRSHLKFMDVEGVDLSVNYPSIGLYAGARDDLPDDVIHEICRCYNDWIAEFCANDRARLYGAGMVPLHDVKAAVAEATRAVEKLKLRSLLARATPFRGRNLGDPYFEPLWEAVESLGVPFALHEAYGYALPQTGDDRYATTLERRSVCHPMEQMMAFMSLVVGGVFERHPKLTVILLEAGASWVPFWLERLNEHAETYHFEVKHLRARPVDYFKRNCFVSTECEDETVKYTIDYLGGADRIIFSTDFPHADARWPHAAETFLSLKGISDADKAKVLWDNPVKLYSFTESELKAALKPQPASPRARKPAKGRAAAPSR